MTDSPTDLTAVNPSPSSPSSVAAAQTLSGVAKSEPTPDEKKRGQIATWLVAALVCLVVATAVEGFWLTWRRCADDASCKALTTSVDGFKTVVEIVLTPMVGLVGAVTGFYFGGKAAERKI